MALVRAVKRRHGGKDPQGCAGTMGFLLHQSFFLSLPVPVVMGRVWSTEGPHAVVPQALLTHQRSSFLPPSQPCVSKLCSVLPLGTYTCGGGTALSHGEPETFRVAPPNTLISHSPPYGPWISKIASLDRGTWSCTWDYTACPGGA